MVLILLFFGIQFFLGFFGLVSSDENISLEKNATIGIIDETPKQESKSISIKPESKSNKQEIVVEKEIELGQPIFREFNWDYGDSVWYLDLQFYPGLYQIYKERSRERDFDLFASDNYDDQIIKDIVTTIKDAAEKNGISNDEVPYLVTSFVQSLTYTSDKVTTGYDEYPRFPYETLYDNGGDCEDTSILVASLLQEMGYGVVLIKLPDHMAVGVKCDSDMPGYSYSYEGDRYCYLETTAKGWPIGEMPPEYENLKAQIEPIYKKPYLE